MEAEIKAIYINDILDIKEYYPEDVENFSLSLTLIIGPRNQIGEESFSIEVCTPKWMLKNLGRDEVVSGRHKLIVLEYNAMTILSFIKKYVQSCSGETWEDIATKIAQLGYWEFEDYRE